MSGSVRRSLFLPPLRCLFDGHPDSALTVLDGMDAVRLPRRLRMRHHLSRALAQNRADIPFTSDSTMTEVAEYYESHGYGAMIDGALAHPLPC